MSQKLNVLAIGASRNIGYFATLRLLKQGSTVTLILRSKTALENDPEFKPFLETDKARLVQGDATNEDDVRRAWAEASRERERVDLILCTIGATTGKMALRGFLIDPHDLCTRAVLTVLRVVPPEYTSQTPDNASSNHKKLKIIFVSSTGLTRTSRRALPWVYKPLYGWLLGPAHADKRGAERVLAHSAGWEWDDAEHGIVSPDILAADGSWKTGIPDRGEIDAISVKAAALTSGECIGDKEGARKKGKPYRFREKSIGSAWTISRKDVAHFVVEELINKDTNFKDVHIAY